ncbi:MAG: tetratricopeptide repeat protein [Zavarzinella sp.]
MPTLNVRLFFKLFVVACILAGSLAGVYAYQMSRIPKTLLWQADKAIEAGDTSKAMQFMRRYLEYRPDDTNEMVRLADLVLEKAKSSKDYQSAMFLYEKAYRTGTDSSSIAMKLIPVCLKLQRYADAEEHINRQLEQEPNKGELHGYLGECYLGQEKAAEAEVALKKAIELEPTHTRSYELLFRIYRKDPQKRDEVNQLLARLTQVNPSDVDAMLLQARWQQSNREYPKALVSIEAILKIAPENAPAHQARGEVFQAMGKIPEAKEAYQLAIDHNPKVAQGYRALSWLHLMTGDQDRASAVLHRGVKELPNDAELLTPHGDLLIQQNELQEVAGIISRLTKNGATRQAKYLQGRLYIRQGKWYEAQQTLESLRGEVIELTSLSTQINVLLAECYEHLGDFRLVAESLQRALTLDPNHVPTQVLQAKLYLNQGNHAEALKLYRELFRSPYGSVAVKEAYLECWQRQIMWGQPSADEREEYTKALEYLVKKVPDAGRISLMLAQEMVVKGKQNQAASLLTESLMKRRYNPYAWVAHIQNMSDLFGTSNAPQLIVTAKLAIDNAVELQIADIEFLLAQGVDATSRIKELLQTCTQMIAVGRQDQLLATLASHLKWSQHYRELAMVQQQLVRNHPKLLQHYLNLLETSCILGNQLAVTTIESDIARNFPEQVAEGDLIIALAGKPFHAPLGKVRQSMEAACRSLLVKQPDHVVARRAMARVAWAAQDERAARSHLEVALAHDPTNENVHLDLIGLAIHGLEKKDPLVAIQRSFRDSRLNAHQLMSIIATTAKYEQSWDWITRLPENVFALLPMDVNRLAQSIHKEGQAEIALNLASKALAQHQKHDSLWETMLQLTSKDEETHRKTWEQCRAALSDAGYYRLLANVKSKAAQEQIAALPKKEWGNFAAIMLEQGRIHGDMDPANTQIAKYLAEKDLQEKVKQKLEALQAQASSNGKSSTQNLQLTQYIEGIKSDDPTHLRNAALKLSKDARAATGKERLELYLKICQTLEQLCEHPQATDNEKVQLAQAYRMLGRSEQCSQYLEKLNQNHPENLLFLVVYTNDLLRDQQLKSVEPLLPRLQKEIADPRVASALIRYNTMAGLPKSAIKAADQFVSSAPPGSADAKTRRQQVAELMDLNTRYAMLHQLAGTKLLLQSTCESYEFAIKHNPDLLIQYCALLGFAGDVPKAFELLDAKSKDIPLQTRALAGVGILRGGHAEVAHFQRVQVWLEELLKPAPDNVLFLLSLGELHTLKQDFTQAEAAYRQVLRLDQKNLLALNNLAWVLATEPADAKDALVLVDRAIKVAGSSSEILDTRARVLITLGQFQPAVSELTASIEQGRTPLRLFHLALAYLGLEQRETALKLFQEATQRGLDPKSIHPRDTKVYQELRQALN